jgi:hypothetical protein
LVDYYKTFYDNLQILYIQNNYNENYVWNLNKTSIQTKTHEFEFWPKRVQTMLHHHSWQWLIMNCIVNVACKILPRFYIFMKGERLEDDYIKFCKTDTCMTIPKKWMSCFLFKEFFFFFQTIYSKWDLYNQSSFTYSKSAWIPCYPKINKTCISFWLIYDHPILSHLTCTTTFRCSLF